MRRLCVRINHPMRVMTGSRSMSFFREIVKEWQDNAEKLRPMDDAPGTVPYRSLSDYMKLPLKESLVAFKDAVASYKLTWTDIDAATHDLKIDEEIIRELESKYSARQLALLNGHDPESDSVFTESDMKELVEKIKLLLPEQTPTTVPEAINALKGKQDDIKLLATDRLEAMADATEAFMEGYNEGKEEAVADVESGKYKDSQIGTFVSSIEAMGEDMPATKITIEKKEGGKEEPPK